MIETTVPRNTEQIIRFFLAIAVVSCLVGCAGPPQTIRIDDRFDAVEVATIQDAVDQWCEKTAYCPELVRAGGEARILLKDTPTPVADASGHYRPGVGGHTNRGQRKIYLSDGVIEVAPEMLWVIIAHELGHLQGINHHGGPECTMYWEHNAPVYTLNCEE